MFFRRQTLKQIKFFVRPGIAADRINVIRLELGTMEDLYKV